MKEYLYRITIKNPDGTFRVIAVRSKNLVGGLARGRDHADKHHPGSEVVGVYELESYKACEGAKR